MTSGRRLKDHWGAVVQTYCHGSNIPLLYYQEWHFLSTPKLCPKDKIQCNLALLVSMARSVWSFWDTPVINKTYAIWWNQSYSYYCLVLSKTINTNCLWYCPLTRVGHIYFSLIFIYFDQLWWLYLNCKCSILVITLILTLDVMCNYKTRIYSFNLGRKTLFTNLIPAITLVGGI